LTVKEIKDPAKEKEGLHSMAAEFGYSLVPIDNGDDDDKSRDSLMMLVHESGTKPFGDEFKSPDQVQEFLEKVANGEIDAGDDEDGINVIDDVAFDQLLHDLPEVRHAEAIKRREAGEAVAAIAKSYGIKPKRRIAPPTKSKMKKALGDHHDAPKITSLLHLKIARLGPAQNLVDVIGRASKQGWVVRTVRHETAGSDEFRRC
jgi:hypothetical protein